MPSDFTDPVDFDPATAADSDDFYSKANRKRRLEARRQRTKALLSWTIGPVIFIACLILAGKLGIEMAEKHLPESAKLTSGYPVGAIVIAGSDGEPVFLAETIQGLRNFYFKYPSADERRDGDFSKYNVRRIFGRVELATLKSDADGVKVQVRTGPLADTMYWIHIEQLPKKE